MTQLLIFLLSLYQLNSITFSESMFTPQFSMNSLTENEDDISDRVPSDAEVDVNTVSSATTAKSIGRSGISSSGLPLIKSSNEETEIEFDHPIASVSIDYSKNAIVLQFQKQRRIKDSRKYNREVEEKRRALDQNFMRFGRSRSSEFMRFGKRQIENLPHENSIDSDSTSHQTHQSSGERFERSDGGESIRDSRSDNFMRFGRSPSDFMRFGRSPSDFMRFGRSPSDFMRFGRSPSDFMRFGRSLSYLMGLRRNNYNLNRFGRGDSESSRFDRMPSDTNDSQNFMRFGRNNEKMRFGRSNSGSKSSAMRDNPYNRYGRTDSFMRLGRSHTTAGETKNFMRFGKLDRNFMRFGKRNNTTDTSTRVPSGNATNESNPTELALKSLFRKELSQGESRHREDDSTYLAEPNFNPDYPDTNNE